MASSGNFCTLNPLAQLGNSTDASTRAGGMSEGNLKYVNQSGNTAVGTFGVTSGKWYYEVYVSSFNADNGMAIGWANDLFNLDAELGYNSPSSPSGGQAFALYSQNQKLIYGPGDGGGSYNKSYGSGTPTDGDIFRIWLDADNGRFWAGLNGTIYGSGDPSAGTGHGFGTGGSPHNIAMTTRTLFPAIGNWSTADATVIFNFGQDSTFQGAVSAGGNADDNGFGDFKYDPDGFLALCTANLPTSDDIDPSQTDSNYGATQFGTVSYTGTGSSNARTGLGFKPDLVWIKRMDDTAGWKVTDSTRGVTKVLQPTTTSAEETDSNGLTSFDSDGFTVGSDSSYNASSSKILAYAWRANGGTTSSNTDGSITTTIQTSDSGGFSIIKYTGTGSNATIGHGLSKAPDFMIFKCTTSTDNWIVYHREFGAGNIAELNNSGGWGSSSTSFQSTDPDNSVITLGTSSETNNSGGTMICYAWASIDGYSNFSSYVGNANTDGPFVHTSFLPKMTWFKRNGSGSWIINTYDENSVDTSYINPAYNPLNNRIRIGNNVRETGKPVDFLANGFKLRHTDSDSNLTGVKYPVICWGSVPFKYNNTF